MDFTKPSQKIQKTNTQKHEKQALFTSLFCHTISEDRREKQNKEEGLHKTITKDSENQHTKTRKPALFIPLFHHTISEDKREKEKRVKGISSVYQKIWTRRGTKIRKTKKGQERKSL